MPRALWQLLLEDPSSLTCDECFAVMEYYAEVLTKGGVDLLPEIIEHLERCPDCRIQYQEALRCLLVDQVEESDSLPTGATGSSGPNATDQRNQLHHQQERGKSLGEEP
jgi:hypothetical protein